MPNNSGYTCTEVCLYPCLQYCKGGHCRSQVCCLLELLQWFWLWKARYAGKYGKDSGYGKNSSDIFSMVQGKAPKNKTPDGQYPSRQNPNHFFSKCEQTPTDKNPQPLILDMDVQTFLMYKCMHGGMHAYIHIYIHICTCTYNFTLNWLQTCCYVIYNMVLSHTFITYLNNTSLTYNKPLEQSCMKKSTLLC